MKSDLFKEKKENRSQQCKEEINVQSLHSTPLLLSAFIEQNVSSGPQDKEM